MFTQVDQIGKRKQQFFRNFFKSCKKVIMCNFESWDRVQIFSAFFSGFPLSAAKCEPESR